MTRLARLAATTAAALLVPAFFVSSSHAQQGDTRTIQVTSTVKGSCRFESTPNINFGELDPGLATDREQSVDISFKCTKGVSYELTVGNGLNYQGANRMRNAGGTDYIPYEIVPKSQTGSGRGFGSADTIKIKGTVKGTDYQNVSAGAYADTVVLSIQP